MATVRLVSFVGRLRRVAGRPDRTGPGRAAARRTISVHCGGPGSFEYAPEHADDFERLVDLLRAGPEWRYVVREVDLRLTRSE